MSMTSLQRVNIQSRESSNNSILIDLQHLKHNTDIASEIALRDFSITNYQLTLYHTIPTSNDLDKVAF